MSVPSRIGIDRPRHKHLMDTHHQLRESLRDAQQRSDAERVVRALGEGYPESPEGLQALLRELEVTTPGELLDVMRMLTLSAGHTALMWAGGLSVEGGQRYSASDVLSTSWARVEWHESPAGGLSP